MIASTYRFCISILIFNLVLGSAFGQIPSDESASYSIASGGNSVTILFSVDNGHIMISGVVAGKTVNLILDTGMPFDGVLIHESPELGDLEVTNFDIVGVMGPGGDPVDSKMAQGMTVTLPGLKLNNQMVLVMPYDARQALVFKGKHGIIGFGLFNRFIVEIDFHKSELTLHEPDGFVYQGQGTSIPLILSNNFPSIDAAVVMSNGIEVKTRMVVYLGSSHPMALNVESQPVIQIPKDAVKGRIGRGVTGDMMGYVGRIQSLRLGDYTLKNIVSYFQPPGSTPMQAQEKDGRLGGAPLFGRFTTIFDYHNQRLILEPNESFSDPFEYDKSGLQVSQNQDGNFVVDVILDRSPAQQAKLLQGDIIVGVDGQRTKTITLSDFENMLKTEGKRVSLDIKRGEKKLNVEMTLRQII